MEGRSGKVRNGMNVDRRLAGVGPRVGGVRAADLNEVVAADVAAVGRAAVAAVFAAVAVELARGWVNELGYLIGSVFSNVID